MGGACIRATRCHPHSHRHRQPRRRATHCAADCASGGQIAAFPRSGRRVADYGRDDVRELSEGDYRLIYRILSDRIDVLTVMHSAQLLPHDMDAL
ncbi:MAG: hypothetical protein COW59_08445 [Lysobacterales bacterium CG17_big_fil_post_rev_8_21_14_2_50_64_11]|nr:MAG: hypothetical protein COW59_08445 [Xanthomonadales bacterium CG17_big_fil_post_rev_8_21_14_2_50_64_11]PIX60307.1 MAG: hypothetical protein COZ47_07990 [Xanthomonadales bacterium CG_4_10_14_3_um_filter_64_11]